MRDISVSDGLALMRVDSTIMQFSPLNLHSPELRTISVVYHHNVFNPTGLEISVIRPVSACVCQFVWLTYAMKLVRGPLDVKGAPVERTLGP